MISTGKNKKHAELQRPRLGRFGRNELAIYGTSCSAIREMVHDLRRQFTSFNFAYADADHHPPDDQIQGTGMREQGNVLCVEAPVESNEFLRRAWLNDADAVLVNGNHFEAQSQVIVCNKLKEGSLRKRASQLTNVVAIILEGDETTIPDYVAASCDTAGAKIFRADQKAEFYDFYKTHFLQAPPLYALILAGGASVRMGEDKSMLAYHGQEQYRYLNNVTEQLGLKTYISCREDQAAFFESSGMNVIRDRMNGLGPAGGIVSAFMTFPDAAWLVVACDIPLLDSEVLKELIGCRKHEFTATAFRSPYDGYPEPLIAIWEPKSYAHIMQFISQGYSCPRKVLINTKSLVVECSAPEKLKNVNTKEERTELETSMKRS